MARDGPNRECKCLKLRLSLRSLSAAGRIVHTKQPGGFSLTFCGQHSDGRSGTAPRPHSSILRHRLFGEATRPQGSSAPRAGSRSVRCLAAPSLRSSWLSLEIHRVLQGFTGFYSVGTTITHHHHQPAAWLKPLSRHRPLVTAALGQQRLSFSRVFIAENALACLRRALGR